MTLNRTASMRTKPKAPRKPRTPLNQISKKRREEFKAAGIDNPMSSFLPSKARATLPVELTLTPKMAAQAKAKHRKPALPAPQMVKLKVRSGGVCEIQLAGCQRYAIDPAHRKGTKAGGRHGEAEVKHSQLSNVLHACRWCHTWCHDNTEAAKAESAGWMLDEHEDPLRCPVKYRGEMKWLLDDGSVVDYDELAA